MAPRPRSELQALLLELCDNVYFQPPPSISLSYPCIIYKRSDVGIDHADNAPYNSRKRYQIMVVDRDPDSDIPDQVATLPTASFDRHYAADDLNHDVYNVFF